MRGIGWRGPGVCMALQQIDLARREALRSRMAWGDLERGEPAKEGTDCSLGTRMVSSNRCLAWRRLDVRAIASLNILGADAAPGVDSRTG